MDTVVNQVYSTDNFFIALNLPGGGNAATASEVKIGCWGEEEDILELLLGAWR